MARDNTMEVRILPHAGPIAVRTVIPRLVYASYVPGLSFEPARGGAAAQGSNQNAPTPRNLIEGSIGCAVGQGAQCLGPVPAVANTPAVGTSVAKASQVHGNVTLTHNGVTKPLSAGDSISMGDTIASGANSGAFVQFADNTQLTFSENARLKVDDFVYDPNSNEGKASYSWLTGTFEYVSGLMAKHENPDNVGVQTGYGCICIRGTEFIARHPSALQTEIDLIHGTVDIVPKQGPGTKSFDAPVAIMLDRWGPKAAPLTQSQYNAIKVTLSSATASPSARR